MPPPRPDAGPVTVPSPPSGRASGIRPGRGLAVAVLLLLALEAALHGDALLHRYRSVFAAGRALDKLLYVERTRPELLIIGNSRADNGFDPATVTRAAGAAPWRSAFNLGVPGADAAVLDGLVERLDRHGVLGPSGVRYAVLALDESMVQSIDTLGQEVFFVRPQVLWDDDRPHDALRAVLRLYGYSANLKQLREPAMLIRFVQATLRPVEPVGGAAAEHAGYRAGFGGLQRADAALRQEAEAMLPPHAPNQRHVQRLLERLQARGVKVAVVPPPLLLRASAYFDTSPAAAPYRALGDTLRAQGWGPIALEAEPRRDPAEYVNPGHLNDQGAQRFSRLLGERLGAMWAGAGGTERTP